MTEKLIQMNNFIEKLIPYVDEETILFIFGDHGMTSEGDHGGDSKNEINSAFFAYSKRFLSLIISFI